MFKDISLDKYDFTFELQWARFLRDCLYEEIDFQLNKDEVIIYKKLDSGISKHITLDELIYFIHYDVAYEIRIHCDGSRLPHALPHHYIKFRNMFARIKSIKDAVENMKIILKYRVDKVVLVKGYELDVYKQKIPL